MLTPNLIVVIFKQDFPLLLSALEAISFKKRQQSFCINSVASPMGGVYLVLIFTTTKECEGFHATAADAVFKMSHIFLKRIFWVQQMTRSVSFRHIPFDKKWF